MFHIRRYKKRIATVKDWTEPVATYPDEPATRETFVANINEILTEEDAPRLSMIQQLQLIEWMSELNKDMMRVWGAPPAPQR